METTIFIIAIAIIITLVIIGKIRYNKNKKDDDTIYGLEATNYEDLSMAWKMYKLLNEFRDEESVEPVIVDELTTQLALDRCYEMIAEGKASHAGFADEAFILLDAGADHVGENVGYGYGTAKGAMNAFWLSEKHRKNMLNSNYDWVGIAVVRDPKGRNYFCMLFGGDTEI